MIDDQSDPGAWAEALRLKQRQSHEAVNSPPHYTDGGIETIDFIVAKLTDEQFRGYCLGNALKYISRAGKKTDDPAQDLRKAIWYLNRLVG